MDLVDVDELARQSLAKHQFSARSFSATALQNYASCPYRFFLSAILRFNLRQEPAAIEVIDPLTRGSLFHETQFEVLTGLRAAGLLPLQAETRWRRRLIWSTGRSGVWRQIMRTGLHRRSRAFGMTASTAFGRICESGCAA